MACFWFIFAYFGVFLCIFSLFWRIFGVFLAYFWRIFGVFMAYFWCIFGAVAPRLQPRVVVLLFFVFGWLTEELVQRPVHKSRALSQKNTQKCKTGVAELSLVKHCV